MHQDTGEMFTITSDDHLKILQQKFYNRLIPLTKKQAKVLTPLSRRKRLWLMNHGSCPCGSGKSFKKCCS